MKRIVDIEGWIIAGGASSRMGVDKAGLKLNGVPLIELSARALVPLTDGRISIAGDAREFAPQYPAYPDEGPVSKGPMSGLLTTLTFGNSEWIAVISCDMPFVTPGVYKILASAISAEADAVIPLSPDGRVQPLAAIYRRKPVSSAARSLLISGSPAMKDLLQIVATRFIRSEDFAALPNAEHLFFNINSPADLETAQQIAAEGNTPGY